MEEFHEVIRNYSAASGLDTLSFFVAIASFVAIARTQGCQPLEAGD